MPPKSDSCSYPLSLSIYVKREPIFSHGLLEVSYNYLLVFPSRVYISQRKALLCLLLCSLLPTSFGRWSCWSLLGALREPFTLSESQFCFKNNIARWLGGLQHIPSGYNWEPLLSTTDMQECPVFTVVRCGQKLSLSLRIPSSPEQSPVSKGV